MKKHKDILRYTNFAEKEETIFVLLKTIDNMSKVISILKDEIVKLSSNDTRSI
jgi:hypothetical protein